MGKNTPSKLRLMLYPVVALVFFAIAYIIIITAIGYDIKFEKGSLSFKRTGAIVLSTRPGDARVYVDGKLKKDRTPLFRLFTLTIDKISPGTHFVKIEKDGYENWEANFEVEPGKVAWGANLIMVAQKREPRPFSFSGKLIQEVSNREKSKLAVVTESAETGFTTVTEVNTNSKETIKVTEQKLETGSWRLLGYSWDSDRILATNTKDNVVTYWAFDSAPSGKAYDISSQFKFNFVKIAFNPRNHDELYLTQGKDLQVLNYVDKKLGSVIANNVINIYPSGQGLLVVITNGSGNGLWRIDTNGNKSSVIEGLPSSDNYFVEYVPPTDDYLVLPSKDQDLLVYSRESGKMKSKEIADNVDWFATSPQANMVFYKSGKDYLTYNFDRAKNYNTLIGRELGSQSWFSDEVNMVYSENGQIKLVTREGFYDKFMFESSKDFPVIVSQNSDNIFYTAVNPAKNSLDLFVYTLNY
jgi:hypothetical protein